MKTIRRLFMALATMLVLTGAMSVTALADDIQPVSVQISGLKQLFYKSLPKDSNVIPKGKDEDYYQNLDGTFEFVLKQGDKEIRGTTATYHPEQDISDSAIYLGSVSNGLLAYYDFFFEPIEYKEPGVYEYTIEEVEGGDPGIVYDKTKISISVIVSKSETEGKLVAEVKRTDGRDGPFQFMNWVRDLSTSAFYYRETAREWGSEKITPANSLFNTATIYDRVAMTNLPQGEEFKLKGEIVVKSTGKVIAEAESDPFYGAGLGEDQEIEMDFGKIELDAYANEDLVIYETLYKDDEVFLNMRILTTRIKP